MDEKQKAATASRVRSARKSRGWSQADLASHAGVAPGTVVSIENAKNVRPGNLRAVLDALEIQPATSDESDRDGGVQLALDVVEKWLVAIEDEDERNRAVQELVRFVMVTRR